MWKHIFYALFLINISVFGHDPFYGKEPGTNHPRTELFIHEVESLMQIGSKLSDEDLFQHYRLSEEIHRLNLPKSPRRIGGEKRSNDDLMKIFDKETPNFIEKQPLSFNGITGKPLILITCFGKSKLDAGTFGDKQKISFLTTLNTFLSFKTFGDYLDGLAILHEWDYYIGFDLAFIPRGVHMQALIGLTSQKDSAPDQEDEIIKEVGRENLSLYTPKKGGAPQIYITHVSHYQNYHLGLISWKNFPTIPIRNVKTNKIDDFPVSEFLNLEQENAFPHLYRAIKRVQESQMILWHSFLQASIKDFSKPIVIYQKPMASIILFKRVFISFRRLFL